MTMKHLFASLRRFLPVALLIGLIGGGCERRTGVSAAGESGGKQGTIGVAVKSIRDPFLKEIAEKAVSEASRQRYEVIVVSAGGDAVRQRHQVRDFVRRGVTAILVAPGESETLGPAIAEAGEADIPVFSADTSCLAGDPGVVSHIGSDNYGGGQEAARLMIEAVGEDGGKLAILEESAAAPCALRVLGFREVIEEYNREREAGRLELVSVLPETDAEVEVEVGVQGELEYPVEGQAGGAVGQENGDLVGAVIGDAVGDEVGEEVPKEVEVVSPLEALLRAHPDLKAVFALDDPSALGARVELEEAGRSEVVIVGFGGRPEGRRAVREGRIYAEPVHLPSQIGIETANAILNHLKGEEVPREILIPTSLYRKSDADRELSGE